MSTLTIDEGFERGIRTQVHFDGDEQIVFQRTFDVEPHLKYAEQARQATEGQNWGEGRLVGHIPDAFLAPIMLIQDRREREKAIMTFLRENPAFVMFDKFLKA